MTTAVGLRELVEDIDAQLHAKWGPVRDEAYTKGLDDAELSKIRDRLNALEECEKKHAQHAKWHEVTRFGERITALESIKLDEMFKTYSNFERRLNELATKLQCASDTDGNHNERLLELDSRVANVQSRVLELETWRVRVMKA
jgi:DNA repair ATPase RecN